MAPSYGVGASEHAYPLEVLAELLGEGATSRLYRSLVVDQALAVGVGVYYDPDNLGPSAFTVAATPRQGVDLATLEAALDAELARLLPTA